ncbi:MAG: CO dehydrogenase/acetyl-CoA synthase complex subunit alpha [Ignisphaera sp.]|nr:CO dehydrogenase/acetyl-CoA synthase complex subunit alpha [Ignisphaera sp.]MCX8168301.1 CO dehydrogenase/acetyl-CoA synthase complex subunit alpha [Ignisphaera sp.]MDW8085879.1 CO dehydrogenase/acetyl-CoA synthase complex subunit alpha [Ignisphaera sp.]
MSIPHKELRIRVDEIKSPLAEVKGLDVSIGYIVEEWEEPAGPTPFPSISTLRRWDHTLLRRYRPLYLPYCDLCCLCTYGRCDLSRDRRGSCGINLSEQQSRLVTLVCAIGASTHTSHARELLDKLIARYGEDTPIDLGGEVYVEMPITRLVTGVKPRTLRDLKIVMEYVERQIVQTLASVHTGQEGNWIDYESKVLHLGMLDHVALELADITQVVALGMPKADPNAPLVDLGIGTVDASKPVILVIGHNVLPSAAIIDYLEALGIRDKVEICGLCCTAHDVARYEKKRSKIIGPISWQLRFIRTGVPDVIVIDEQCIYTNLVEEAERIGAVVIATTDKAMRGLPDRTHADPDNVVEELVTGKIPGALILNEEEAAEVAVKVALKLAPQRIKYKWSLLSRDQIIDYARKCSLCRNCERNCPQNLPISTAMARAAKGEVAGLAELYRKCFACRRCEYECPKNIPVLSLILASARDVMGVEKFRCRAGRGPIQDTEIRAVGRDIVLGTIPGVVAFAGCSNWPNGAQDVAVMAREFASRRYIVVASGCSAMAISMFKNEEGKTPYEEFSGAFEAGGIVNVGSCVANSHIAGTAIKIANIFAKLPLRANYAEIADYILNRVGAVGVAWGAMSQKAAAIAAGFWRLGVPVIVGPHGIKYRRMLLGNRDTEEDWYGYDAVTGERVYLGPAPEHLFYAAETLEEAMVMIPKLCIRTADTPQGRAVKLTGYLSLYKQFYGADKLPPDLHLYIRSEADIPIPYKDEVTRYLKEVGWREKPIVANPTLIEDVIEKYKRRREGVNI